MIMKEDYKECDFLRLIEMSERLRLLTTIIG